MSNFLENEVEAECLAATLYFIVVLEVIVCEDKMKLNESKRLQAQFQSKPWSCFVKKDNEHRKEQCSLCTEDGKRADGRKLDEIRPVHLKTGVVTEAKGSSYYEKDGLKVICSVFGPRESQRKTEFRARGRLICDVTFAPFSHSTRQLSKQEVNMKSLSNFLETALQSAVCLDSFPKSQVEIFVKVLEGSSDVLTAAIISSSLALADAGIEMYDLVTACSLVFDENYIALDPSDDEISHMASKGHLTVGYLPSLNRISCILQNGNTKPEHNIVCIKKCIEGCIRMHGVMHDCLVNGVQRKQKLQGYSKHLT